MNKEEIVKSIMFSLLNDDKLIKMGTDLIDKYVKEQLAEQLRIGLVSQQRELLGCSHNQIRVDGKDVGACVKCGVKMEKNWQPNCG